MAIRRYRRKPVPSVLANTNLVDCEGFQVGHDLFLIFFKIYERELVDHNVHRFCKELNHAGQDLHNIHELDRDGRKRPQLSRDVLQEEMVLLLHVISPVSHDEDDIFILLG